MAAPPVSIKLRCASWQQLQAIYKRDLARGAIFLKSAKPPPIGTPVRIDLTLPTDSMIVLNGYIGEHVPEGGLGGRGPGVDVKLAAIPQSAMWLIETALASAQRGATPGANQQSVSQAIRAPSSDPAPVDGAVEDGSDVADAENELLAALAAEHDSLRKLNPFQLLGVGYEATDNDVRAAFGELTKRYHPDRFARYASNELKSHAAEIFILIRDAYRRIGDDKSRAQAREGLGPRKGPPGPPPGGRASTNPGAVQTPPVGVPAVTQAIPKIPPRTPTPPVGVPVTGPTAAVPRAQTPSPAAPVRITATGEDDKTDYSAAESLLDQGKYEEALAVFKIYARKNPTDRTARAGMELAEGMKALAQRDRLEAAQRFEVVLEIDPSNERAARELAEMRRLATNERKGLLSRLLGKKE
ncbi:MAG TPA: DnaJ domain-containing protein [Kofleriaceae bacterium]|jgi:TolA-binding protein|nr:DnaJ domain-containing protein [Kofleriaceae bacterium]